ncbi:hypothetical protein N5C43_21455 [Comamonas terrigena]|uniref:hypothetical protein n=1 Tax=Comamonas terrigena TaxID=32013 RepID=UPI0024493FB2|nr:hypothetical protein [Comamonas terrigena]MDH1293810.1 hypothetical protein [Comamonas terrigena]
MDMKTKEPTLGYITLPSKLIHLDPENPRHEPQERDAQIISELCDDHLVNLASDIAKMGALSPLEVLGVTALEDSEGHYVVVEGNRRTCALLLLADPSRAPTREFREKFQQIADEGTIPEELTVFVFPNRETAQPWIERRHLGPQNGIGTREWDNPSKTRAAAKFSTATTAKADLIALAVVNRLVGIGMLTKEKSKEVSLTTLTRYLNNKTRRASIGIQGLDENNDLVYTHRVYIVDGILKTFVEDSFPKNKDDTPIVNSRTDAEECGRYFRAIAAHKIVPANELASPTVITANTPSPQPSQDNSDKSNNNPETFKSSDDGKNQAEDGRDTDDHSFRGTTGEDHGRNDTEEEDRPEKDSNNGGSSRNRSARNPTNRPRVLEQSFTIRSKDKILLRLRGEMLSHDTEKHELGTNYLIRAFVERILMLYLQRNDSNRRPRNDQDLTQKCADDAKSDAAPQKVQHILNQAASQTHCGHSLHTLGTAIHGGIVPTRTSLNNVFDTWEPALRYMLDALPASS